ncbi:hypothetical protein GCM10023116_01780 [Kistimonas scapharcae]|uniref:Uncharacterized protein n=1 Tax=Kistimonas scapharcae TaxID=1036133 RepID=A0ABP8UYC8_9GAMM
MKTINNPTEQRLRLVSLAGDLVTFIQPGETRTLRDEYFLSAMNQGCLPAGEDKDIDNPVTEIAEDRVAELAEVMHTIILEGGDVLTGSGCPKASILKERFGEHTKEEREAAFDKVQAEQGE